MRLARVIILFYLSALPSLVQGQSEGIPLKTILSAIEEEYNVTFSYRESDIELLSCERPDFEQELEQVLKYLSECTGLAFERIDERFIAVRKSTVSEQRIQICGTLTDIISGEFIPFATVSVNGTGTTTDEGGRFSLSGISPDDQVVIRSLGYELTMIEARELTSCPAVQMKPSVTRLDEVVIRDYLVSGISLNASGIITVMARELGSLPGLTEPDVLFTIQTLPGIISVQESVSDINIRGGTNDQNLVLWEDMRMYQTGHFFGLISAFNPYLTDEVSLIQQGTPARFSDAVSGVLDIRSDDEVSDSFHGGAGINMINADVYGSIPVVPRKASILISARRSIADILETPTYSAYFERAFQNSDIQANQPTDGFTSNEYFEFNDLSAKLLIDATDKLKIRGNFLWTQNELTYAEEAEVSGILDSRNSGISQESIAGNIKADLNINSDISVKAMAYVSTYALNAVNNDILNDQRLIQENEVIEGGVKTDVEYLLNKNLQLNAGYHFSETGVTNLEDINNPVFRRRIKRVLRIHSPYTEAVYKNDESGLFLRGGMRFQYLDKFSRLLAEPRLTARKRLLPDLHIEVSTEKKSQSITQVIDFQTDFLGIEKRRWLLSNDGDIPVAISWQHSGGFHFQRGAATLRAIAYHRKVEGVSTATQGFQNEFQFERIIGSYTVNGADFLFNWKSGTVNTWVTYSFARNTFKSDSLSPPSFPNTTDITHALSAGLSYENEKFRASAGLTWHTGKPYSKALEIGADGRIIYEAPNRSRLRNYFRMDVSAGYKFLITSGIRAEAGISVWNILDRNNISNIFYRNTDNGIQEVTQQALGITPNAMFRIYF